MAPGQADAARHNVEQIALLQTSSALWETFRGRTGGLGGAVAVSAPGRSELTFAALWEEADRLASLLGSAGVAEGAVAGLALPSSPCFLSAFLALCRLDTTVALMSPRYGATELVPLVQGVRPQAIVTDAEHAPRIAAAVPIARSRPADGLEVLLTAGDEAGSSRMPAAILKFSSGSTSEPKGIALTAASVVAAAENVMTTLGLSPEDRVLAPVPLFHSYGFDLGVLQTLHAGTTLVLEEAFVPRRTLTALARGRIGVFLGVPAQYRVFLATRMTAAPRLSSVHWLLSCTAPLGADLVAAFHDRFGAPVCQHYGSSETGAVTNHVPSEVLARPSSVGRPIAGVRVDVAGPDGAVLPAGVEGEIVVSGAAVARGYVMGAPPGNSPFRAGSFWTGDVGVLDADGFLTLHGRRDAMINVGGLKVSPAEVVATLERHPMVREAAVVGVPDGGGEEAVYAVVVLAERATEEELLRYCHDVLAEHKVPRRIEIRDALPRTPTGKVRLRPDDLEV